MSRAESFDKNRNLDDGMENTLHQQDAIIAAQGQQIQQLQQQLQQHQQLQQQQEPFRLGLLMKPKDIIEQFRSLKPLDETHNTRSFIRSVESTMALCKHNVQLYEYGLQIVVNEKILGNAGQCTRELECGASWEQVKEKILLQCQSKKTGVDKLRLVTWKNYLIFS